jgi:hypothetical protein
MAKRKPRVPISKVADKVYEFLLGYYADNGYMPTQLEIAQHFTNPATREVYTSVWASYCLRELEKQGRIKLLVNKHRGIVLRTRKK